MQHICYEASDTDYALPAGTYTGCCSPNSGRLCHSSHKAEPDWHRQHFWPAADRPGERLPSFLRSSAHLQGFADLWSLSMTITERFP